MTYLASFFDAMSGVKNQHLLTWGGGKIIFEDKFAEVGQVITRMERESFFTPDMASKNDARYVID